MQQSNNYKVLWNGKVQPIGSNSWHSVRMYILSCLAQGSKLNEFKIIDKWGEIKTSLVNDKDANPTLSVNYSKLFN